MKLPQLVDSSGKALREADCSAWSRLPGPSCSRGLFAWSLQRPVGVREKEVKQTGTEAKWVCLKIGYIPNYSHLIGIMISKTIGFRGTLFSDKPKWRFPKMEVPIGTPNHPSHGWPCLVLKPPNVDEMLMSFSASQAFWQQRPKASGLLIPTAPQRMLSCVKWLPGLRGGLSRSPLTSLPSRIWINVHFRAVHNRPRLRQQPAATGSNHPFAAEETYPVCWLRPPRWRCPMHGS